MGHTLTGVWVEISSSKKKKKTEKVTPSRVCELKFPSNVKPKPDNVTPSRVCELKLAYPI